MNDEPPILSAKGLMVGYGKKGHIRKALLEIPDLAIRKGQLVGLLGANGSGKSTLIRTLGGLQAPLAGDLWIQRVEVGSMKPSVLARKLSVVLTDRMNTGNLSVYEVVALGRIPHTGWFGTLNKIDEDAIDQALDVTEISAFRNKKMDSLSDGEKQKVMLARAFAQDTDLIILDEPTAHLDLPNRLQMMKILRKLTREVGKAILISSHELDLTLQTADRLWLLAGKELTVGFPEDLVLNGAFQKTFSHEGIHFDNASGTFLMDRPVPLAAISVSGHELAKYWLTKALLREGIGVVEPDTVRYAVVAELRDDHYLYKFYFPGGQTACKSIEALMTVLKEKVFRTAP